MLKHYFITALRNIYRHRITTAINVVGLTLGLAFFILVFGALTALENSERQFANSDRIYFVANHPGGGSRSSGPRADTPKLFADYLRTDFPDIEHVSHATARAEKMTVGANESFIELAFTDPAFLQIFALPFLQGEARTALDRPDGIILAQSAAQKLFGSTDVIGKTVQLRGADVTVTAVLDAIPGPTHLGPNGGFPKGNGILTFEAITSLDVLARLDDVRTTPADWWIGSQYITYVLLPADGRVTKERLNRDLPAFVRRHVPAAETAALNLKVTPIADLLLFEITREADVPLIAAVLILGSLILSVACVNYANLATAQAMGRSKEIGLRRVLGARPYQLVGQYLMEAALHTGGALIAALSAAALFLPIFNRFMGFEMGGFLLRTPSFWVGLFMVLCAVSVAAGAYPALVSVRATPVTALRVSRRNAASGLGLKTLVGVQFAITSFLLVAVFVMQMQKKALLGYIPQMAGDTVVEVKNLFRAEVNIDTFLAQIKQSPHIKSVSAQASSHVYGTMRRSLDPSDGPLTVTGYSAYYDFFDTVGIKLLVGRSFSPDRSDDIPPTMAERSSGTARPFNIVVDAAFAAQMSWTQQEALGKTVYSWAKVPIPATIVGVVENKAWDVGGGGTTSIIYQLGPLPAPGPSSANALVRVRKSDLPTALADIDAAWKRLAPTTPITRVLKDEEFAQFYSVFSNVILAIAAFGACGIFIAISGLIGMAIHVVSQRTHEIGVRRTLGSTVTGIMRLLLLSFTKPIIVGNIVGWPLAYILARFITRTFINPVAITPLPFVLSLIITVLIGAAAVAAPAWRAARVNPAEVLHYE